MFFDITVKRGVETVATLKGVRNIDKKDLNIAEAEWVIQVEAFLEKLTGYRFHINER